jgi:hypothetical protein
MKVFWFSFMVASNILLSAEEIIHQRFIPVIEVTGGASEFIRLDYLESLTSLFLYLNLRLLKFDNKKCHRHFVYGIDELPFLNLKTGDRLRLAATKIDCD